jgi:tetratricopeptide (TPR) repeat protein
MEAGRITVEFGFVRRELTPRKRHEERAVGISRGISSVSRADRVRRQQLLREAEGYLDLATVFSNRWGLAVRQRDVLAQRALDQIEKVKQLGGALFEAHYLEGEALRTLERWPDAIVALEAARDEDATNIHVALALAWCYKRSDRLDLAIEALEEAISHDPTAAILHYNLACYWSLAGKARRAVEYLSEAFDLDPDYRDMVGDEADFNPIRRHPAFISLTSVIV